MNDEDNIIEKDFESCFAVVDELQDIKLLNFNGSDRPGSLSIERQCLQLFTLVDEVEAILLYNREISPPSIIESKTNGNRYRFTAKHFHSLDETDESKTDSNVQFQISQLLDERWDKDESYFYRFIIPIQECFWTGMIQVEAYNYKSDGGKKMKLGLVNLKIAEDAIQIYQVCHSGIKYMAIESQCLCTYERMCEYLTSISLSLGLAATVAPFDYTYIFASKNINFEDAICCFYQLRKTIEIKYPLITTDLDYVERNLLSNNAEYALSLFNDEAVKANFHRKMTANELSNLALTLYEEKELSIAALMLLESSNLPMKLQGGICSTALETLREALTRKENKLCMEESLWKNSVKPAFDEVICKLRKSGKITAEQYNNINNKLRELITISNNEMLKLPFKKVGYELSKKEVKVIKSRNDFLHGRVLDVDLLYTCLELQKLCALLIFKKAGYNGYVLNNAFLLGCKMAIDEPVLVK